MHHDKLRRDVCATRVKEGVGVVARRATTTPYPLLPCWRGNLFVKPRHCRARLTASDSPTPLWTRASLLGCFAARVRVERSRLSRQT